MKIKALSNVLREGTVALISSEINRFYFTEFLTTNGFLVVGKTGAIFITDGRYIESAKAESKECEVVLQKEGEEVFDQLLEIIKSFGKEVLIEASKLSISLGVKYEEKLSDVVINKTGELDEIISSLRIVKKPIEIEKLERAQRIAEKAFDKVLEIIKPGILEKDIAIELEYLMKKNGATDVSFETIVVTGANSSKPHGVPGMTAVKNGDFITIDFGAVFEGYCSDTTRTVGIGKISDEQRKVYDLVLKAQEEGIKALRPGASCREIDVVCRDIISAAGYREYFSHGTGHGVGVEIHEAPTLNAHSKEHLRPGHVVTVEPGIYLPGKFGVRIEDMLFITETGYKNFTTLPKMLTIL
ncbi:MAG: aminopeptidase P family protein [Ruminococcaceae bacterium]|nr:aminopeptidase P family protein [Oscillospiraceae bacterium]